MSAQFSGRSEKFQRSRVQRFRHIDGRGDLTLLRVIHESLADIDARFGRGEEAEVFGGDGLSSGRSRFTVTWNATWRF